MRNLSRSFQVAIAVPLASCLLALAACTSGSPVSSSASTTSSSSGVSTGSGGSTPTTPPATGSGSVASVEIAGSPAATATAGSAYRFQPRLEQGGGTVTYSIVGCPIWATFSTTTGALSGTPSAADEGKSALITISASNGTSSASLPPFTIQVVSPLPPTSGGSASLSWTAPTTNTDGSQITDLAGYHIYYGATESKLQQVITITDPTVTTFVIKGLAAGTYYFTVGAYNSYGIDSRDSNISSKIIKQIPI